MKAVPMGEAGFVAAESGSIRRKGQAQSLEDAGARPAVGGE